MKPLLIALLAALALTGCATKEKATRSQAVSIRPNSEAVAKPVAETRKAVTNASASVTTAQTATAAAKALAAKTVEAAALARELDKIEFTLNTTQIELTAALKAVTDSERAVGVLESQIAQQTAELTQLVVDHNALAAEKRAVEIKAAENNLRKKQWRTAFIFSALLNLLFAGGIGIYVYARSQRFI